MAQVICGFCNKEFKKKDSQIKLGLRNFCSKSCCQQGNKRGEIVECFTCKTSIYKSLKDINRSKSKNYFCSQICSNVWVGKEHRASNHSNWTTGESSYKISMKREGFLQKCFLCGEQDSRVLAVHHIDENRKNNNLKNLIGLCHNCHFLIHHHNDEINKFCLKLKKYAIS